ncbi:MAG: uncharacterized protein KVP18_000570 [Porospora cf. gigantea A]|uniref:uncharacterized protein n=1 Tax=Porospora cf. gigantea A TaxID=2853593 RepID=UPI00355A3E4B|nr:MAG: hypothetical protein KVP18_000570 [Porospora cf. gigantea A]
MGPHGPTVVFDDEDDSRFQRFEPLYRDADNVMRVESFAQFTRQLNEVWSASWPLFVVLFRDSCPPCRNKESLVKSASGILADVLPVVAIDADGDVTRRVNGLKHLTQLPAMGLLMPGGSFIPMNLDRIDSPQEIKKWVFKNLPSNIVSITTLAQLTQFNQDTGLAKVVYFSDTRTAVSWKLQKLSMDFKQKLDIGCVLLSHLNPKARAALEKAMGLPVTFPTLRHYYDVDDLSLSENLSAHNWNNLILELHRIVAYKKQGAGRYRPRFKQLTDRELVGS